MIARILIGLVFLVPFSAAAQQDERPTTLLRITLTLDDRHADREWSWIGGLDGAARTIDGIILKVPSWQEAPDAMTDRLVLQILLRCQRLGLDVYLGRNLWISWPTHSPIYAQSIGDPFCAAHYAGALSRLAAEADIYKALGFPIAGTYLDAEAYGDSLIKRFNHTFEWPDAVRVRAAIDTALLVAPQATVSRPVSSARPNHVGWALRHIGREYLQTKTYEARSVDELRIHPPDGDVVQMDWWGTWIKTSGPPGSGSLLIDEWRGLDWRAIREAYPELVGCFLHADADDRLDVMRQLGQTPQPQTTE